MCTSVAQRMQLKSGRKRERATDLCKEIKYKQNQKTCYKLLYWTVSGRNNRTNENLSTTFRNGCRTITISSLLVPQPTKRQRDKNESPQIACHWSSRRMSFDLVSFHHVIPLDCGVFELFYYIFGIILDDSISYLDVFRNVMPHSAKNKRAKIFPIKILLINTRLADTNSTQRQNQSE